MEYLKTLVLGIVQGLCEFLPVSSSGHLSVFQQLFGMEEAGLLLDTMLHIGTLMAVFVVLWPDIWSMLKKPFSKEVLCLIIATVPAVIFTLLFGDFFDDIFAGRFLGISFLLTSAILFASGKVKREGRNEITLRDSLIMGVWQAVAILPGVSRSGSTIAGGLFAGLNKSKAARFSFLMSIPAILGSLVFQVKDIVSGEALGAVGVFPMLLGVAAAAVSGYFAIRFMLRILEKHSLKPFAVYTLALGLIVLLDQLFFNLVFVPMF